MVEGKEEVCPEGAEETGIQAHVVQAVPDAEGEVEEAAEQAEKSRGGLCSMDQFLKS